MKVNRITAVDCGVIPWHRLNLRVEDAAIGSWMVTVGATDHTVGAVTSLRQERIQCVRSSGVVQTL